MSLGSNNSARLFRSEEMGARGVLSVLFDDEVIRRGGKIVGAALTCVAGLADFGGFQFDDGEGGFLESPPDGMWGAGRCAPGKLPGLPDSVGKFGRPARPFGENIIQDLAALGARPPKKAAVGAQVQGGTLAVEFLAAGSFSSGLTSKHEGSWREKKRAQRASRRDL